MHAKSIIASWPIMHIRLLRYSSRATIQKRSAYRPGNVNNNVLASNELAVDTVEYFKTVGQKSYEKRLHKYLTKYISEKK